VNGATDIASDAAGGILGFLAPINTTAPANLDQLRPPSQQ
jgi:hypothetical protein